MPGFYTEADYENSIIELFQNMGYHYVYGPDVDRDFSSPLYEVELDAALHCLNPTMPEDAIADALFKLKNLAIPTSWWIGRFRTPFRTAFPLSLFLLSLHAHLLIKVPESCLIGCGHRRTLS